MAEEAALVTATETVVSVLVVRFVGDDTVVAILLSSMSDNLGPLVMSAIVGHVAVLSLLHLVNAPDCLLLVAVVVFALFPSFIGIVLDHLHKSLALAGSGRLIVYRNKILLWIQSESHEDVKDKLTAAVLGLSGGLAALRWCGNGHGCLRWCHRWSVGSLQDECKVRYQD